MKKACAFLWILSLGLAIGAFLQAQVPTPNPQPTTSSVAGDSLTADENKHLDVISEIFRRQREERDDLVARYKVVSDQLAKTQKELEDFAEQALAARGLKKDSGATIDLSTRKVQRPQKSDQPSAVSGQQKGPKS